MLGTLRALIPTRRLQFCEALRIAELQANRLLGMRGITEAAVPSEIVTELPRITIEYAIDMPFSGASCWDTNRRSWIITLNALEPDTRHRFSLLHEYKHIVDHGHSQLIYSGSAQQTAEEQAEQVADYFAGCALMPKRLVKQAWGNGVQRPHDLAELFDVSPRAMQVRLSQLGLTEPMPRCAPPRIVTHRSFVPAPRRSYHRQLAPSWPAPALTEARP
ncbi:MAG: ImmA/IrrE family metallo-endopeptidase [Acidothermales bacterium]|nr:ImmA/IrrE family metallo-endopeptidase [Acidothermales bacterium]